MKVYLGLMAALLVGCGGGSTSTTNATSDLKVALITDTGKINDGTFNQSAYEGGIRASKAYGLTFDYRESGSTDNFDADISYFVDQGFDMIITVGFLMGDVTKAAAEDNPDVKFAIVDVGYDTYPDNLIGLGFAEDHAGYMAGALAGKVTASKTVGVVGGMKIPPVMRFVNGYVNGVKANCPTCTAKCAYIASFGSPTKGAEVADSMMAAGADVIFGAGGPTGSGGVLQATKKGAWGIGVDTDEYHTTYKSGAETSSTKLLASAIKNIDEAVFQAIKTEIDGTFKGGTVTFDASNNGVGLSEYHSTDVSAAVKTSIETIINGLADGTVTTGVSAAGENTTNTVTCDEVTVP